MTSPHMECSFRSSLQSGRLSLGRRAACQGKQLVCGVADRSKCGHKRVGLPRRDPAWRWQPGFWQVLAARLAHQARVGPRGFGAVSASAGWALAAGECASSGVLPAPARGALGGAPRSWVGCSGGAGDTLVLACSGGACFETTRVMSMPAVRGHAACPGMQPDQRTKQQPQKPVQGHLAGLGSCRGGRGRI